MIKSGYKVVVFHGSFIPVDSTNTPRLSLQFNGVRLARSNAKLGFLSPRIAKKPISLQSIKPCKLICNFKPISILTFFFSKLFLAGGLIHSMQFRIIYKSPMMTKIKLSVNPKGCRFDKDELDRDSFYSMEPIEYLKFKIAKETFCEEMFDNIINSKDLSIESIIEEVQLNSLEKKLLKV